MNKKRKLTPSEKTIVRELIFMESFQHLEEETGLGYGTLRDDLITLINHRMVEVFDTESEQPVSPFYDSDNIRQFSFKATNAGLKKIQEYDI